MLVTQKNSINFAADSGKPETLKIKQLRYGPKYWQNRTGYRTCDRH
jgi:hypothetical protein